MSNRVGTHAAVRGRRPVTTLHDKILQDLRGHILSGHWPPGHRLPVELELTATYRCSRMTVSKVIGELVRAGLVERRRRAGSFVAAPRSQAAVLQIEDIRCEVEALGQAYRYQLMARRERRATRAEEGLFGVSAGSPILAVEGLHFAGAKRFCHETRLINLASVPFAAKEPFSSIAPGPWLIAHVPWSEAEHRIRAIACDATSARALRIGQGTACLAIERRTWRAGSPVTHVKLVYPGEARELVARFAPAASGPGAPRS
jgi:GntR family histidine utilization transcriptional repressor